MTGMNVVTSAPLPVMGTAVDAEEEVELREEGGGVGGEGRLDHADTGDDRYEIPLFGGGTAEEDNLCSSGCYAIVDTGTSGERAAKLRWISYRKFRYIAISNLPIYRNIELPI